MNTLYITVGAAGSGKSTWTNKKKLVTVSSDDVRQIIAEDINDQSKNKEVFKAVDILIRGLKDYDGDIILDSTNCNLMYLKELVADYEGIYNLVFVCFPITTTKAYERVQNRLSGADVPWEVINAQVTGYHRVVNYLKQKNYNIQIIK